MTVRAKRGYCARRHDRIRCFKKTVSSAPRVLFIRGFIAAVDFSEIIPRQGLTLLNINIVWPFVKLIGVFASLLTIPSPVELVFCACFLPVVLIPRCSNPSVCSAWSFDLVLLLLSRWMCPQMQWRQLCQTSLTYWLSSCLLFNRLLKKGMIWCPKNHFVALNEWLVKWISPNSL